MIWHSDRLEFSEEILPSVIGQKKYNLLIIAAMKLETAFICTMNEFVAIQPNFS